MTEEQTPKSWWKTLPGTLTALAGVITALATLIGVLNQSGIFDDNVRSSTPTPEKQTRTPQEETTEGWTIIGKYKQGKFFDLKLMVHGDSPAIGRSYDAVDNFRLVLKRGKKGDDQGQVITLGMVHRGDSVEVLDLHIKTPSTKTVSVWAKLRAVIHKR